MYIPQWIIILHFSGVLVAIIIGFVSCIYEKETTVCGGYTPRYDPTYMVAPIAMALAWEVAIFSVLLVLVSELIIHCLKGTHDES